MLDANVLVIDNDSEFSYSLSKILSQRGYEVITAKGSYSALKKLENKEFDIVFSNDEIPGIDCIELLGQIKKEFDTEVVLVTEEDKIQNSDTFHYIDRKSCFNGKLEEIMNCALESLKRQRNGFHNIVGNNKKMQEVYTLVKKVADSNVTVLIGGETGTGKDLISKAIHNQSPRRKNPFIKVDCAGIPEQLLESNLFGHVRGAFTTAVRNKKGKFELADKGTIFFDDIDCLPMNLQAKLLRVLQDREFERVGDTSTQKVDVRVIAASNQELQKSVNQGNFRADLFYRLNVIHIGLPPLRERLDDLEELAYHFLKVYNQKNNKNVEDISPDAFSVMKKYSWPGNIRELENVIERAVILKQRGCIEPNDLKLCLHQPNELPGAINSDDSLFISDENLNLKDYVKEAEKHKILTTLERYNWKRNKTAEVLDISRITLYNKIKEYGLEVYE